MCKVDMSRPNPKYINPMTDFGFKKIFSDPTVMLGVIADIVQPSSPITELTFLDPNMLPSDRAKRGLFYDLHCKTEDGQEFIVEMQKRFDQLFRGIDCIDFFKYNDNKSWEKITTIDLPSLYILKLEECKSGIERWAYFMNNVESTRDTLPFAEGSPAFTRAYEIAELANMSDEDRYAYQADIEFERSNAAAIDFGLQEAHEQGLAEGRVEGRAEGLAEGLLQSARLMLKSGMTKDAVATILHLTAEQVAML